MIKYIKLYRHKNFYNITMEVLSRVYFSLCRDKRKRDLKHIRTIASYYTISTAFFCPKGSKLYITNNILFIQTPNWSQGILRSYNQDQRDDLFFILA